MRRLALLAGALATGFLGEVAHAQSMLHTPAPNSPERAAILDGLRAKGEARTRVFVVRELRVAGDWAWVEAEAHSADDRDRDEAESALLRREGGAWRVVDQPCGEAECDAASELARIRVAHPRVPIGIVPLSR